MNSTNSQRMDEQPNFSQSPATLSGGGFASLSRTLGILALFFMFFTMIYGAMICGGLAIILAVLSKGYHKTFSGAAVWGVICGSIAVGIETILVIFGIYAYLSFPDLRHEVNTQYQYLYEQFYQDDSLDDLNHLFDHLFNDTAIPRVEGGDL